MKICNFFDLLPGFGLLLLLLALSGCNFGYHHVIPAEFPQYLCRSRGMEELGRYGQENLRVVQVYDEFETVALFDFLRNSDEIALICADLKSDRHGASKKNRQAIQAHELAANQAEFKFLLQADVRKTFQEELDKKNSPWSFWLEAYDGQTFKPASIKKIKHTDITRQLFGDKYSRFKNLYQLTFSLSGNDLTQARIRRGPVAIVCRSSEQKCKAEWPAAEGWTAD